MERITSADRTPLRRKREKGKGRVRKKGASGTVSREAEEERIVSFSELFPLESTEAASGHLEDLLDEIHEKGEFLKEQPTLENIREYRQSVSNFMKFVVKNSLETDTVVSKRLNPLKKQKRYTIIRIINRNLEELASGVLQNQMDQLEILDKIDEISGLLVNLLK